MGRGFTGYSQNLVRSGYTVKPILRDHCHERPRLEKPHIFWQKHLHFNITEPVTRDHLP